MGRGEPLPFRMGHIVHVGKMVEDIARIRLHQPRLVQPLPQAQHLGKAHVPVALERSARAIHADHGKCQAGGFQIFVVFLAQFAGVVRIQHRRFAIRYGVNQAVLHLNRPTVGAQRVEGIPSGLERLKRLHLVKAEAFFPHLFRTGTGRKEALFHPQIAV